MQGIKNRKGGESAPQRTKVISKSEKRSVTTLKFKGEKAITGEPMLVKEEITTAAFPAVENN